MYRNFPSLLLMMETDSAPETVCDKFMMVNIAQTNTHAYYTSEVKRLFVCT